MSKKSSKVRVSRTGRRLFYSLALIAVVCALLMSCNVTRTITTQSEYFQKGDTTCTIVTKTIETYDATKKL